MPITHLQVRLDKPTSPTLHFPIPTRSWGTCFERSAIATGEQEFPVKWFKFIYPKTKPRMTETSVPKLVHVAYSPSAYINYQWTINLLIGYPLRKFCYQKSTFCPLFTPSVTSSLPCFTLVMITFVPPKSYYPLETMGRD